jgi:hypothetical protein
VKVGYRQASYLEKPAQYALSGLFAFQGQKTNNKIALASENFCIVI